MGVSVFGPQTPILVTYSTSSFIWLKKIKKKAELQFLFQSPIYTIIRIESHTVFVYIIIYTYIFTIFNFRIYIWSQAFTIIATKPESMTKIWKVSVHTTAFRPLQQKFKLNFKISRKIIWNMITLALVSIQALNYFLIIKTFPREV